MRRHRFVACAAIVSACASSPSTVRSPSAASASEPAPATRIELSYSDDVPDAARAVFQYAASRWEQILVTSVPIRIRVGWIRGNGPDGFCFPNAVRNFDGAPHRDVWYPSALADAVAGRDLQPGEDDMNIFIKERDDRYYGFDAQPGDKRDLVTTAMHEIAHGLGLTATTYVPWEGDVKEASVGMPNSDLNFFKWSFKLPAFDGTPSLYDAMIVDGNGQHIIETSVYPNPSAKLLAALKGTIAFDGPRARAANGGKPIRVDESVSHIARTSTRRDSGDWLMTPALQNGVAQHDPGPLLRAILEDLGWTLRPAKEAL